MPSTTFSPALTLVAILGLASALSVGCESKSNDIAGKQLSHIRLLTNLYVKASAQLRHNPTDEAEFKQAIAASDVKLENLKVDSVDDLFVSERDGKPLVVIYGSKLPASEVIIYEQEGVNGRREVGYTLGKVSEVDAAEFAKLVPNASE